MPLLSGCSKFSKRTFSGVYAHVNFLLQFSYLLICRICVPQHRLPGSTGSLEDYQEDVTSTSVHLQAMKRWQSGKKSHPLFRPSVTNVELLFAHKTFSPRVEAAYFYFWLLKLLTCKLLVAETNFLASI